jgi:hypothetical protein
MKIEYVLNDRILDEYIINKINKQHILSEINQ